MRNFPTFLLITIISAILLQSCAHQQRPVLYPNKQLTSTSREIVDRDIDNCIRLGKEYVASKTRAGEVAVRTTRNAAIAAATGAAISAIVGGNVGEAAAAGAAGAGTATVASEVTKPADVDPLFRNFVEKCLRDKGYEVMGWR